MLSIPKIIVLILVAIAGWYLYKAIKRRGIADIDQLDIRFALDLYAGVRPIRSFAGLPKRRF